MKKNLIETVVRSVGAVLILLSVFLAWFAQASLFQFASFAFAAQGVIAIPPEALLIVFGTLILVVAGALVSFRSRTGGVLTIVGVIVFVGGLGIFVPPQFLFGLLGIGIVVAIVGATVVFGARWISEGGERLAVAKIHKEQEMEVGDAEDDSKLFDRSHFKK